MSMATYRTTMDKRAKIISFGTLALLCTPIISVLSMTIETEIEIGISFLFLAIITIPYLYSPRQYGCDEKTLTIHRFIGNINIDTNQIINVRQAEKDELNMPFRLWGSGGYFGYFGKFSDRKHRTFRMYCRRLDKRLLVFTKSGLIVLSPDDCDEMMKCLRKSLINK